MLLLALSSLGLVVSFIASISVMYDRMMSDRIEKLNALAETIAGLASGLDAEVTAGRLTREAAIARLRTQLHPLRFGSADSYFVVQDDDGVVLVHGGNPALEGKRTASHDAAGRSTADLIRAGVGQAGAIRYLALKPGQTVPQEKLSAVVRFAPWHMNILAGSFIDDVEAAHARQWHRLALIGAVIFVILFSVTFTLVRNIVRSFGNMRANMAMLAAGDLQVEIAGLGAGGEVGAIAQSLQAFKIAMIDAERLRAEQARVERELAEKRRLHNETLAADFESRVGGIVENVADLAKELQGTAKALSAASDHAHLQSNEVANAAMMATGNVQTVASAAEQLSASIREISKQISEANGLTQQGVRQTMQSTEEMHGLSAMAAEIGQVVQAISDIAGQTNMLALNATIEAARAGSAGKGFAVVASEVKSLAVQTARATQDISSRIATVQAATRSVENAIQAVCATISGVNDRATSIAAAVEQQSAATAEISRNVLQAAESTARVSSSITEVTDSTGETGSAAARVLASASRALESADSLKSQVTIFLRDIRAAEAKAA
jgi:methyl-accepting chemotaxis protein